MAWVALAVFGLSYLFVSGARLPGTGLDRVGGALAGAVDWDTLLPRRT